MPVIYACCRKMHNMWKIAVLAIRPYDLFIGMSSVLPTTPRIENGRGCDSTLSVSPLVQIVWEEMTKHSSTRPSNECQLICWFAVRFVFIIWPAVTKIHVLFLWPVAIVYNVILYIHVVVGVTDAPTTPTVNSQCASNSLPANLTGSGQIASPNYPLNYPNNVNCNWRISALSQYVSGASYHGCMAVQAVVLVTKV